MLPILPSQHTRLLLTAFSTLAALTPLALRADVIIDSGPSATLGTAGSHTLSGSGSTLTVTPGADLDVNGATDDLVIGLAGTGSLTITDGASVSVPGTGLGFAGLGAGAGSTGSLTISAGGSLSGGSLYVGGRPDATGTLLVTGAGSSLTFTAGGFGLSMSSPTSSATITSGASYTNTALDSSNEIESGSLTVSAGATLTTGYSYYDESNVNGGVTLDTTNLPGIYDSLGLTPPASLSATMLVTGAGTTWNNTGSIYLSGNSADTVSLTVTDHATLNHTGSIGVGTASTFTLSGGATATLTNAAAAQAEITIEGGTLALESGATLAGAGAVTVGASTSSSVLTVSGGATLNTSKLNIGSYGEGFPTEFGGTLIITGTGSTINVSGATTDATELNGTITITDGGALNTDRYLRLYTAATVSAGGSLTSTYSTGISNNSFEGALTVTGVGSTFSAAKLLSVYGPAGSLTVTDHADFTLTDRLHVGNSHTGTFTLSGGATATTNGASIGYFSSTAGTVTNAGHATVTGAGTTWNNNGSLLVGVNRYGDLTISSGAVVNTASTTIASTGNTVVASITVTGAGSQLNNTGALHVGSTGPVPPTATLTIADHGLVTAASTTVHGGDTLALGTFGALDTAALTVASSGTVLAHDDAVFAFTLGAPSLTASHTFAAGSNFTIDGGATVLIDLTTTAGFGEGTYTLFAFDPAATLTGVGSSAFSALPDISGYAYAFDFTGSALNLIVTTAAVPEPASFATLAGLATLALATTRRRRA